MISNATQQQVEILLESKAAAKAFLKSADWKREPYDVLVVQYTSTDISALTQPLKGTNLSSIAETTNRCRRGAIEGPFHVI